MMLDFGLAPQHLTQDLTGGIVRPVALRNGPLHDRADMLPHPARRFWLRVPSGTLTFPVGTTSQTVSVQTAEDADNEGNETFTLTLSSPVNATLGDATATGTINDAVGQPTLNVSGASANEGAAVEFTVSLSVASGQTVTVQYATSSGTATSGTEFTPGSGRLTARARC